MGKHTNRIPSALKYGIYSGIGFLPTESRAKFRKFRKEIFADLNPVGPLETDIVEEIVRLEWRRKNLFTYDLAQRARARRASIESEVIPPMRYSGLAFLDVPESVPDPENPSPQQLRAARRRADKRIQIELGAARELVELGDVVTFEHLD